MRAHYRAVILAATLIGVGCWMRSSNVAHAKGQIPDGSYKQTCWGIYTKGHTLGAMCKRMDGALQYTELKDFHLCVGGISNKNGNLRCDKGEPAPAGSYTDTCFDIRAEYGTLYAMCRSRSGLYLPTSLADYKSCVGGVANLDGFLRCNKGGTPPAGSYSKSCRDTWVSGSTLHSSCKDWGGGWRATTLNEFKFCRTTVSNMDGYLTCVRGYANPPAGSFYKSCRNINFDSTGLAADCKTFSGSWLHTSIMLVENCRSAVSNMDGHLTCDMGLADAPAGSYKKTCRNIFTDGTDVSANCRRVNGDWHYSKLVRYGECKSDIHNGDGDLRCTR
jgi:hypothetical protein